MMAAGEWRSDSTRIAEELMVLTNNVPLTPEVLYDLAPMLIRRFDHDASKALDELTLALDAQAARPEFAAARAALGLDPRITDPSKQQRLSDLNALFGRTGWRNAHRWTIEVFDELADRFSNGSAWPLLFEVNFDQDVDDETFDVRIQYSAPNPDQATVRRISLNLNDIAYIEWMPVADETIEVRRLPSEELDDDTIGCFVDMTFTSLVVVEGFVMGPLPASIKTSTTCRDDWRVVTSTAPDRLTFDAEKLIG